MPVAGGASEYASAGKVKWLDRIWDLEEPGALEAVIKARAYKKELIFTIFNPAGAVMGLNFIANMASLHMEHYLIIANTPALCEEFQKFDKSIACVWTSYLQGHEGLARYEVQNEEGGAPFRLWWARFDYMAKWAEMGYNPMYIDIDVSFRMSPYPVLKGPLGGHNLITQRERHPLPGFNIGIVYCQGCAKGTGAHWVLEETVQRMKDILEAEEPVKRWDGKVATGAKELLWDQHIFNDVAETAAGQFPSFRRSHQRLIEPSQHNQWIKDQKYPDVEWKHEKLTVPPGLDKAGEGSDVAWYDVWPYQKTGAPKSTMVASPGWLMGGWSGIVATDKEHGVWGWWNTDPPPTMIAHFVGAINKVHTMKVLGWWWYGAEALRPRAREAWEGDPPEGMLGVTLPGLRFSTYEGGGPDAAQDGMPHAIVRLLRLAVAAGRTPVVPQYDCESPWINKDKAAWHGIRDREKIVVGRCEGGVEPCCSSLPFTCANFMLSQAELEFHHRDKPSRELPVSGLGGIGGSIDAREVPRVLGDTEVVLLSGVVNGAEIPEVTGLSPEQEERVRQVLNRCPQVNCEDGRTADFPHPGPCRHK